MKRNNLLLLPFVLLVHTGATAQADSFRMLKDKFSGSENVHTFSVSGGLCRAVLWLAGEWEFRDAIKDVSSVKVISIPRAQWNDHTLFLKEFKASVKENHFESLASIRDHGDHVEVYVLPGSKAKNKYLLLAENDNEVTVIEVKGDIDIQKLQELDKKNGNSI
jgi:Domain of unknown function (DUF4252)